MKKTTKISIFSTVLAILIGAIFIPQFVLAGSFNYFSNGYANNTSYSGIEQLCVENPVYCRCVMNKLYCLFYDYNAPTSYTFPSVVYPMPTGPNRINSNYGTYVYNMTPTSYNYGTAYNYSGYTANYNYGTSKYNYSGYSPTNYNYGSYNYAR